ncbi:hypothetical protein [Henriciella aquimarina]|uniref:hypothetical protein n=1 Tax=Henriciella aquimarina TaxID=545261 RepID=UPI0009FBD613|nr:hypothetical protein [Henriciella aquimarina]
MTRLAFSLAKLAMPAIMLAGLPACGAKAGGLEPTISGEVTAPDGAGSVLTEFVKVCAPVVVDDAQPGEVLAANGWEMPSTSEVENMARAGTMAAEKADLFLSAQVTPIDFPHLQGVTCMVNVLDKATVSDVDLSGLEGVNGFIGDTESYGDAGPELGRWSGVAADGQVITIYAMKVSDGRYLTLSMNKSKPVQPAPNDAQ